MPSKFVVGLRACCLAVVLTATIGGAAESKSPSLVGATREQVLERLGEPKSSIVAGAREVLLFERERVVLRNNVVIEVDLLPAEPVRRPSGSAAESSPAGSEEPATQAPPADEAPTEAPRTRSSPSTKTTPSGANTPTSPDDAPLEIRAVRRAGTSGGARPPARSEAADPAPPATAPSPSSSPAPIAAPVPPSAAPVAAAATLPSASSTAPSTTAVASPAPPSSTASDPATTAEAEKVDASTPENISPAKRSKATTARDAARSEEESPVPQVDESVFDRSSYIIALVIVVGGVGYLVWRSRQRKLELAATAVSRTPFAVPVTATAGARFTAELLGKLEWKRFEELVAAYYGKTGVVAVRTKSGPASPVHIKISWKGESRPFAFVQCIAHPTGLIDAKPVQELVAALMAEDIRRGYVVTTGKFNVPARDFAEEKHITLLSGDILLEKLNALPDGARNELMQEIATGDYTTPSCPKCEAKMTRSPDDPSTWRCAAHPEVVVPAWK